jgi:hypothetical protein
MEENSIKPKSSYRKAFIAAIIIVGISVLGVAVVLFLSTPIAKMAAKQLVSSVESDKSLEGWDNPGLKDLWKDKFWIQNQIALAKDDSMSLGVNFEDSTMQLLFKGLTLSKCKILYKEPGNFLKDINSKVYEKFFGNPVKIISGEANTQKKAFRRMKPPTTEDGEPTYLDSIMNDPIIWNFTTSNDIRFVIHGFDAHNDTAKIVPSFKSDILKFRLQKNKEDRSVYFPTLFIWMDDKDAKAIYRALPHEARVIFRN